MATVGDELLCLAQFSLAWKGLPSVGIRVLTYRKEGVLGESSDFTVDVEILWGGKRSPSTDLLKLRCCFRELDIVHV
ncbi:hypothetical protein NPIL_59771 [Nephila pilipes]|uniref:Uncharacterized protein n=1 Tax=Nephila pilipes TaxID=299642 RepID=A0A8X6PJB9_NEPPI|nr:hypothetical protein NPIL_59771 [Nephila pilipes]